MNLNELKSQAALAALSYVKDGMFVGLGTGSTAKIFIDELAKKVQKEKWDITCVATSSVSFNQAQDLGIKLLKQLPEAMLDVTVDGADEISPELNLVKGLGGALLMEKIVAAHTKRQIIIADESKIVQMLGQKVAIPVEVVRFSWQTTAQKLTALGLSPTLRQIHDQPFVTDMGNYILDCKTSALTNAAKTATAIKNIIGVVDHGLFINLTAQAIVATSHGLREMAKS